MRLLGKLFYGEPVTETEKRRCRLMTPEDQLSTYRAVQSAYVFSELRYKFDRFNILWKGYEYSIYSEIGHWLSTNFVRAEPHSFYPFRVNACTNPSLFLSCVHAAEPSPFLI